MRIRTLIAALLLAPLAGCGGGEGNNATNAANLAREEGLGDANMIIGGDEISPIPEAEDDMAANQAGPANAAAVRNQAQTTPTSAPQPTPAPAPPPAR